MAPNLKYNCKGQQLCAFKKNSALIPLCMLICVTLLISSCGGRVSHTVKQVPAPPATAVTKHDYTDSTITVAAGKHYDRNRFHTLLFGKHYREAWATPVQAEVLDLETAKGGLEPLQMGGSRQTVNLRLINPKGTEYVLRSVDKDPARELSEKLQNTYLATIIRDATSATHPYGALTIPPMAEALDIYHTAPQLVFIPHSPKLGTFVDSIGGTLALLERRPDGDQSDNPRMGYAKNVKSTRSALTERLTDNDSYFDARYYLRARLLDMLIGDWSRHEDNWRWAETEHDDKAYTYTAIPRDRDNVYFKLKDGPISWFFMRLRLKPHFQTFRKKLTNIEKLNRSGRNLDELILAELELSDWIEIADSVQHALTDQVLEEAVHAMPDTIYKLTGAAILSKLKSRRAQLPETARKYYNILAKEVQIAGTDKHELFEVELISAEQIEVRMYKTTKEGQVDKLIFRRMLYANETKEVKLYGLGGDDKFELIGEVKPKIKISIWGGAGEDIYHSATSHSNLGKRVHITDTRYRNAYNVNKYISVDIDDNVRAKEFNAEGWLLRYYLD